MFYELAVAQPLKMLKNLESFFDKALAHADQKHFDPEIILQFRLAPDQYPFVRQIQIACDGAKFGAARLLGRDAPAYEDNEKSISELRARIHKTIDYLKTFKPEEFEGVGSRRIVLPWSQGKALTGQDFVIQASLPNLYFHITTAYAILRHNGVDVGKMDYLGSMPFKD